MKLKRSSVDYILANRGSSLAAAGYAPVYPEVFRMLLGDKLAANKGDDVELIESELMRWEKGVAPGYWL